jgi:hypothetical protein
MTDPIKTANMHKMILLKTFTDSVKYSLAKNNFHVSKLKVEKVVNAPRMPVAMNRNIGFWFDGFIKNVNRMPMIKEPNTLTARVA